MKLNLRKIKGFGRQRWGVEKRKAATFLKLTDKMPFSKQIIQEVMYQTMKRQWYRHIDKALAGKATPSDAKHWRRMTKKFKKNIVGSSTEETTELLDWLGVFSARINVSKVTKEDVEKWLPHFKEYMKSCEESAIDNYIMANKMLEA